MTKKDESKQAFERQRITELGEDMACIYLGDNGLRILERKWECESGIADIIADEEGTLAFFTVRTFPQGCPGFPEYALTAERRSELEKIAISYLARNQRPSGRVRFDVIVVQMTGEQQCLLRHHRDAYGFGDDRPLSRADVAKLRKELDKQTKEKKPQKKAKKSKDMVR